MRTERGQFSYWKRFMSECSTRTAARAASSKASRCHCMAFARAATSRRFRLQDSRRDSKKISSCLCPSGVPIDLAVFVFHEFETVAQPIDLIRCLMLDWRGLKFTPSELRLTVRHQRTGGVFPSQSVCQPFTDLNILAEKRIMDRACFAHIISFWHRF